MSEGIAGPIEDPDRIIIYDYIACIYLHAQACNYILCTAHVFCMTLSLS